MEEEKMKQTYKNVFGKGNSKNVGVTNNTEMIADRISSEEPDTDTVEILSNNINNTNNECCDVLLIGNNNASTNSTREYEAILDESSSTTIEQQSYLEEKSPVFPNTQFSQKRTRDFEVCDVTNEGGEGYSNSYDYDVKVEGEGIKTFNCVGEKCLQTDTESASGNKSTRSDFDYLHEIVQNNSDAFTVNEETCKNGEDTDVEFTKSKDEDAGSISVDQKSEVNMEIDDVEIENVALVEDNELENEENGDIEYIASDEDDDSSDVEYYSSDDYDDSFDVEYDSSDDYDDSFDEDDDSSDEDDVCDSLLNSIDSVLDGLNDLLHHGEHCRNPEKSRCPCDINLIGSFFVVKHKNPCVADKPCTIEEENESADTSDTEMNNKETTGGTYDKIMENPSTSYSHKEENDSGDPNSPHHVHKKRKLDVEKDHKTESIAADSPKLLPVLPLIFSYLCFEDLFKARKVCTVWEDATKDTYVWRHSPFLLEYHSLKKIADTPYLHTVSGPVNTSSQFNKLLKYLVKYVRDLRKLDLLISNKVPVVKLPVVNLQKCIKKFKHLEFITIYNSEFVDLDKLKSSCTNLKAISLYCDNRLQNFPHACEVIGNGSAELRKLFIKRANCKVETSKTPLSDLLRRKLRYLTDLSLTNSNIDTDVLDLIFNCKNLKKLDIRILKKWPEITFNLRSMQNLKSLTLRIHCHIPKIQRENLCKKIKFPKNLESLEIEFRRSYRNPVGIISNVINSVLNLRVLKVKKCLARNFDQQLERIYSLPNLHTVILKQCKGYSAIGVEHILKCAELKKLEISDTIFTESTYESLQRCKYLCDLAVLDCILDLDKLLSTILSMKNLVNVHIESCRRINEEGRFVCIKKSEIKNTKLECNCKNRNVKIHYSCLTKC